MDDEPDQPPSLTMPPAPHSSPPEIAVPVHGMPRSASESDFRQRLQRALGAEYEIGSLIGRGGYAWIYAAHDRALDRAVAVKVLAPGGVPEAADPEAIERFRRESRLMARVRHPHIMPIYEVQQAGDLAYFTMPLAEGETLRALLAREGRLGLDEAVRVLREMAAGLRAAHEAGIVHRDVKPENILLEGSARHVLVMDFGIARSAGAAERRLTVDGSVVGTPDYMSPEQASGAPEISATTDIYSFGVVGFELLTGRLPFEATTLTGMLVKHVSAEAPRLEWYRPDCPVELADLIARCLAKHPADRWRDMAELEQALAMVSTGPRGRVGRFAARFIPVIHRGTARRSMVARFRWLSALFVLVNVGLFLLDLRDGALDFAPPLLLLLGFFLAWQFGDLRHAGFTWKDLFPRAWRDRK